MAEWARKQKSTTLTPRAKTKDGDEGNGGLLLKDYFVGLVE